MCKIFSYIAITIGHYACVRNTFVRFVLLQYCITFSFRASDKPSAVACAHLLFYFMASRRELTCCMFSICLLVSLFLLCPSNGYWRSLVRCSSRSVATLFSQESLLICKLLCYLFDNTNDSKRNIIYFVLLTFVPILYYID